MKYTADCTHAYRTPSAHINAQQGQSLKRRWTPLSLTTTDQQRPATTPQLSKLVQESGAPVYAVAHRVARGRVASGVWEPASRRRPVRRRP
eukprot:5437389-Prymnesium_polylepis.1